MYFIWNDEEKKKEYNKKLIEKYPFLIPRNPFSGKSIIDCAGPHGEKGFWPGEPDAHPAYDYEYTVLDEMPDGWRAAFGEQMCEELKEELIKENSLEKYRIIQIKEKYGYLRWYDNFGSEEHYNLIDKYERLSKRTCITCGAPAKWISKGWISPYCDECGKEIKFEDNFMEIERYFEEI